MMPAAILSLLVKTEGATLAAAELKKLDRTAVGVDKTLGRSAASTRRHSRMLGGLATAAKYGGAAMAGGLVVGLTKSISAFQESERVGKQTNAVLKSTGGAANVTKKHVENLATAISRKTGIDDEAVQSSENLLLTFTRVRNEAGKGNDIFTQATKAVQDMSIALGQDGKSSAIQLGKALNDPVKGVTALRRVGVQFTEQQQDQIKTLVKHGDTLKAQKVILHELNTEFGGSAAAAGSTFSGSMQKAKNSVGNLGEAIGGALAPKIQKAADWLAKFIDQMQDGTGAGGRFADKMKTVAEDVGKVLKVVKDVVSWLGRHPALLKAAAGAWVAYKTAALIQIGIVKAASLGLFGPAMRTKLSTEAGKTGTTAGRSFAAKAGLAAAAAIAGWEIGKWLRAKVPAVKSVGDFIGNAFGKAVYDKGFAWVRKLALGMVSPLSLAVKGVKDLLGGGGGTRHRTPPVTGRGMVPPKLLKPPGRGKGGPMGTGRTGRTASVRASASSVGGGSLAHASRVMSGSGKGQIAATIIAVGRALGASDKQILAALEAGIVESGLQNLPYGDRDSVGVFQQRPSQGWTGLMNVPKAAREFFQHAMKVGGGGMSAGQLAQAVQRSAFPGRYDAVQAQALAYLGGGGGRGGGSRTPTTMREMLPPLSKAFLKKHRAIVRLRRMEAERRRSLRAYHRRGGISAQQGFRINRTLDNPWITAALEHIDNLVRAGQMDPIVGRDTQAQIFDRAIASGQLSGENALIAAANARDLRFQNLEAITGTPTSEEDPNQALIDSNQELIDAQEAAAEAAREQAEALNALKAEVKRQTDFATSVAATEAGAMSRWVTEVISKQMGFGISGRSQTPGYGVARRS